MLSFQGRPGEKQRVLEQLQAHYQADEIIQGAYWEEGKGCAVGCILHSADHLEFETRFNIPEWFAKLIDSIFEGLPNEKAKLFPIDVWKAIPEGVDLEPVKWKFCVFLMEESLERVRSLEIKKELKIEVLSAIVKVKEALDKVIKAGQWNESAARSAAYERYSNKLIELLGELKSS